MLAYWCVFFLLLTKLASENDTALEALVVLFVLSEKTFFWESDWAKKKFNKYTSAYQYVT